MTELLFIAITIYFAYVVFEVIGKKKGKTEIVETTTPPISDIQPTSEAPVAPPSSKPTTPAVTAKPAKPVKKTATTKTKATPVKQAAPAPVGANDSLKNPKTGELAKIPGNYAFAKRWIKDALVEEGLLDKVYKNNELDSDTNAKIQLALQQLKTLEKYQ